MKAKGDGGRREELPLPSVLGGARLTWETSLEGLEGVVRAKAMTGDLEAETKAQQGEEEKEVAVVAQWQVALGTVLSVKVGCSQG